ncbi:MAG TPA: hypothetical protein VN933_16320, partial [Candidatus Eremiobacteraceae bacterium]|nr:hypothetical protein [Candidatus Eremiobacteraceae bacterium]
RFEEELADVASTGVEAKPNDQPRRDVGQVTVDHLERADAHSDEQDPLEQLEQTDQPNEPSIVRWHVRIIIIESTHSAHACRVVFVETATLLFQIGFTAIVFRKTSHAPLC